MLSLAQSKWLRSLQVPRAARECRTKLTGSATPPNKGMKLTKLSAAWLPGWTCRLMPAPAGRDAGTASQLIPGVRRTRGASDQAEGSRRAGGLKRGTT